MSVVPSSWQRIVIEIPLLMLVWCWWLLIIATTTTTTSVLGPYHVRHWKPVLLPSVIILISAGTSTTTIMANNHMDESSINSNSNKNNNNNNNDSSSSSSSSASSSCTLEADGTCIQQQQQQNDNLGAEQEETIIVPILPDIVNHTIDTGYGVPQHISGDDSIITTTRSWIEQMHIYMYTIVYAKNYSFPEVIMECKNQHESCSYWASIDECNKNPSYMKIQCAPACHSCEHLSFSYRCPLVHTEDELKLQNIWKPYHGVNEMFERIVYHTNPPYNVTILLQPRNGTIIEEKEDDTSTDPTMITNTAGIQSINRPWIVIIDDFLNSTECQRFIDLGTQKGYEISKDVGPKQFDGTYKGVTSLGRTSTNAWCTDECYNDTMTQYILQKMVNLTGIPDENAEYLQLLRYEEQQFYETHHDYIGHHVHRAQGVRILTVFLYLNTVEEGGGTNFPRLNITVEPRQGRALLWPSVYDYDPDVKDPITDHQALPVIKGIKYGANAWFHQRDFKAPYSKNCI